MNGIGNICVYIVAWQGIGGVKMKFWVKSFYCVCIYILVHYYIMFTTAKYLERKKIIFKKCKHNLCHANSNIIW